MGFGGAFRLSLFVVVVVIAVIDSELLFAVAFVVEVMDDALDKGIMDVSLGFGTMILARESPTPWRALASFVVVTAVGHAWSDLAAFRIVYTNFEPCMVPACSHLSYSRSSAS